MVASGIGSIQYPEGHLVPSIILNSRRQPGENSAPSWTLCTWQRLRPQETMWDTVGHLRSGDVHPGSSWTTRAAASQTGSIRTRNLPHPALSPVLPSSGCRERGRPQPSSTLGSPPCLGKPSREPQGPVRPWGQHGREGTAGGEAGPSHTCTLLPSSMMTTSFWAYSWISVSQACGDSKNCVEVEPSPYTTQTSPTPGTDTLVPGSGDTHADVVEGHFAGDVVEQE